MQYTPYTKGATNNGHAITIQTPIFEWDTTSVPGTTYIRYEDTTDRQYIEEITASTYKRAGAGLWSARTTETYEPFIVSE